MYQRRGMQWFGCLILVLPSVLAVRALADPPADKAQGGAQKDKDTPTRKVDPAEVRHINRARALAAQYAASHKGAPLTTEAVKAWAIKNRKAKAEDFVSTRDGKDYVIAGGPLGPVVVEAEGKDDRYISSMKGVAPKDENEIDKLLGGARTGREHAEANQATAGKADQDARAALDALRKRLPTLLKRTGLDSKAVIDVDPATGAPTSPGRATGRVKVLRRLSPTEAKLVIEYRLAGRQAPTADAYIFIYLRYCDGCWTTTRDELRGNSQAMRTASAALMLAIDELGETAAGSD